MEVAIISFSFPNKGRTLKKLVQQLVQSGLVACVQVTNYVHSYYMHEGKLNKSQEKMVVCKLIPENADKVIDVIQRAHPYSLPEILSETTQCNEAYGERVKNSAAIKIKPKR